VEEKRSRDRSKGEGAMYEWQGRPPHERSPSHLARFLDSLYVVISPLACCCFYVDDDDD